MSSLFHNNGGVINLAREYVSKHEESFPNDD
jgi:hypothetical protein